MVRLFGPKTSVLFSRDVEVTCPRCNGLVVLKNSDPVGFFIEIVCDQCGVRSYVDLSRSPPQR